ncbi:MAG: amidase [Rhodopseudomonas sp.]|nr:amidase [Rhodopseudomonas sp.]
MPSLANLAATLANPDSRTTSRELVEQCLARIDDPNGEGSRAFLKVHNSQARTAADYHDRARQQGSETSPFAGIPISIKDLFDMAGDITTAGSTVLSDAAPAHRDAVAVARLRAAGFIPIGRTNMTEFAFSGLGINPHYGTPLNVYDRATGRIPGGSSSGAAVSVTDSMAYAALGTDTGGSCRIPAALCGLVGFKPTARRVPLDGTVPLSTSLDSIGPIAQSVACCATLDAILAGEAPTALSPFPLDGLRLAIPRTMVFDGIDTTVASAFDAARHRLSNAGVKVVDIPLRELNEIAQINRFGGFGAAESYAYHRPLIARKQDQYDPRVVSRILRGKEQSAADYIDLMAARADFIRRMTTSMAPYDALLMPTVPVVAPPLASLATEEAYRDVNLLMLRNPTIANFIDGCSISIPCHKAGEAPVGLMLIGASNSDARLLAIAAAVENLVSPRTDA